MLGATFELLPYLTSRKYARSITSTTSMILPSDTCRVAVVLGFRKMAADGDIFWGVPVSGTGMRFSTTDGYAQFLFKDLGGLITEEWHALSTGGPGTLIVWETCWRPAIR